MRRTERMQDIKDLPAHHFSNRGGVLIQKEFVGFERYHKNNDSLMKWYQQAFPSIFETNPPTDKTEAPAAPSH